MWTELNNKYFNDRYVFALFVVGLLCDSSFDLDEVVVTIFIRPFPGSVFNEDGDYRNLHVDVFREYNGTQTVAPGSFSAFEGRCAREEA
jgi:hypothetical protein